MPIPNNPHVVKVSLIFQRDSRELVNTFHVDKAAGWVLGDLVALAPIVKTWYDTYYKACIPTTVTLNEISLRVLDPSLPLAYDLPISPGDAGTRTGTSEPANVSITTSWRTGLAGRAFRGRMYLPTLSENDVNANDTITSTLATLLANAAGQLIIAMFNNGTPLGVFHAPHIPPHALDNLFTDIITYVIDTVLDSQRRRLPGRGR